MNGNWELIAQGGVSLWLIGCAVFDLRKFRVPNMLTIPVLVLSVGIACWRGGDELLLLLIASGVFIPIWLLGGMGGGDVKVLIALAGLWPAGFLAALIASALWAVWQGMRLGWKGRYAGIPPAALAALLVWGLESTLLMIRSKQGG